jgi:hypothetical protein
MIGCGLGDFAKVPNLPASQSEVSGSSLGKPGTRWATGIAGVLLLSRTTEIDLVIVHPWPLDGDLVRD